MERPKTAAEKTTKSVVDTIEFTREAAAKWRLPPFQRPLKVNEKVRAVARQIIEDQGVISGVLTFGHIKGDKDNTPYLVDGQHRREAFMLSEILHGYADVRTCFFDSMAEMGEEFVQLNSALVSMRPDDILRGMEAAIPTLQLIRKSCPFVGYEMIRRGERSPILSMSAALRTWEISSRDVPSSSTSTSVVIARFMPSESATQLVTFLQLAFKAWGLDAAYARLWGALNLSLTMWLYRRLVLTQHSLKTIQLKPELFLKCLMSLSADAVYCDWLVGRNLGERDRSPAYFRLTTIFRNRLKEETKMQHKLPSPPWAKNR